MPEIKSIQHSLSSVTDSLQLIDRLNRLGFLLYESNIDSTYFYAKQAREIADRHQYKKGQADALNNMGVVYDVKGYGQMAVYFYDKALKSYTDIHDGANQVQLLMNLAMSYYAQERQNKAKRYFDAALHLGPGLKNDSIMSLLYFNYLLVYSGSLSKDSVDYYIDKTKNIASRYRDYRTLIALDQIVADQLIEQGKVTDGISLLERTVTNARNRQLYFTSLDIVVDLADHLVKTDAAQAVYYYQSGLETSQQRGYLMGTVLFARKLFEFYQSNNDRQQSQHYAALYIQALEKERNIEHDLSIDYADYALKEEELQLATTTSMYQSWLIAGLFVLSAAGIAFLFFIARNLKKTRILNKRVTAQNNALQVAINDLEYSHAENSRMMRIVAHDLRGPISGISSLANILITEPGRTQKDYDILNTINDSSLNLLELTTDLLGVNAKVEDFKRTETNMHQLLQHCVDLFASKAGEKQQQIKLHAPPVVINASREKLWRVVSNLISNAIKFSPEGGAIFVDLKEEGDTVVLSVKDNGIGIPNEIRDKIFELHGDVKRAGTTGEQSFGMGLAISKQIVDAHGGHIWFESKPGAGTTFFVLLYKEQQ